MKNKKISRKRATPFIDRLNTFLDIPPDVLGGGGAIELRGRSFFSLSGYSSILLYTPSTIRLLQRDTVICIRGESLECTSYHKGETSINGRIDSVSFEEPCEGEERV
jgi:sporulation protein YqfC